MGFNQIVKIKNIQFLKLFVAFMMLIWSDDSSSQTVIFQHDDALGGSNNDLKFSAIVDCHSSVTYRIESSRDLKGIFITYESAPAINLLSQVGVTVYSSATGNSGVNYFNSPHTNPDFFPKDVSYSWVLNNLPNFNANALVTIEYEYWNGIGWVIDQTHLDYAHFGSNTPTPNVDFQGSSISPNNYSFDYIGVPLMSLPGASYYSYALNIGDGVSPITGSETIEPLVSNSFIGNGLNNPHFYCRANLPDVDITADLIINVFYATNSTHILNSTTGHFSCEYKSYDIISLVDLCPLFTGFSANNIDPTEFDSEVTTSSSGNSILDGMVGNSISVERNSSTILSGLGTGVTNYYEFPNSTPTPISNDYQNYTLEETIVIEPGCSCVNEVYYNTNNPCFNLSDITATNSFLNGEYVYTFTLSDYVGGSSNTYTITSVTVDFGDGASQTFDPYVPGTVIEHVYPDDGSYTITQTVIFNNGEYDCKQTLTFGAATYCCINFAPTPNDRYWLSAWVKEDHATQQKTYENTYVEFSFDNGGSVQLHPSGDIIEGWQRIVGEFTIPSAATNMQIDLVNESTSIEAYFDDVRVHPFNASMKSYVYDPETLWLTAELDDNNYATFYEYDKEGQLIRIKKETARGIMTIQESRSSNPKSE